MKYTYPDAEYWIQYLEPVEAAYLILYTGIPSSRATEALTSSKLIWPKPNSRGQTPGFEIEDDTTSHIEGDELVLGFENDKGEMIVNIEIYAEYSGYFTPEIAATHWDPPEGGESVLSNVDTESIVYWGPVDEELEITPEMFTGKDYTYKDMFLLADEIVESMIDASDSEWKSHGKLSHTGLPQSIVKSIERVREENKTKIAHKKANQSFGL